MEDRSFLRQNSTKLFTRSESTCFPSLKRGWPKYSKQSFFKLKKITPLSKRY